MSTAAFIHPLPWDTAFFGFPTGRIEAPEPDAAQVRQLLHSAHQEGYRLLYWFIAPEQTEAMQLAYAAGAQLVDDKHVYSCRLPASPPPDGAMVVQAGYYPAELESLALQSGEYSRFRTDQQFPAGTYERLYRQWLRQTQQNTHSQVLVYPAPDGSVVGMVTLEAGSGEDATIGLLAVDSGWRQQGIGRHLVLAVQAQAAQDGFRRLLVTTQGANLAACGLYERTGFALLSRRYVFHLWLGR